MTGKGKKRAEPRDRASALQLSENGGASAEAPEQAPAAAEEEKAVDERFLRLQADFENFRRRIFREREDLYRRANQDIMLELLPVLDHLELALEAGEEHDCEAAVVEGIRLVWEQALSTLSRFGLVPVDPVAGAPFDPNLHEAVAHVPSEGQPENVVVTRVRRGYLLGAMLLRPAQVVVSAGPPAGPGGAGGGTPSEEGRGPAPGRADEQTGT